MLYYSFRKLAFAVKEAVDGLLYTAAPSPDDDIAPFELLQELKNTQILLADFLCCFPEILDDYKDTRFGPVIHENDLKKILANLVNALTLNEKIERLSSYFPARLLRFEMMFLCCILELLSELKEYASISNFIKKAEFLGAFSYNELIFDESLYQVILEQINSLSKQALLDVVNTAS